MKNVSGKEFARIVEKNGWKLLRVRGSHHVFGKAGEQLRLSIPIHGNHSLKMGMLRDMLKVAGLQESDLE